MTTEERIYKLEGIVEGVMATLRARSPPWRGGWTSSARRSRRRSGLRREVEEKFNGLRQEVKAEIQSLRQEMAGLRQEMASFRQEMEEKLVACGRK